MSDNTPNIPAIPASVDSSVRRAFDELKRWFSGTARRGGALTRQDMIDAGVIAPGGGWGVDIPAPPQLALAAEGGFAQITLTYTDLSSTPYLSHYEIFRATVNDVGQAVKIGSSDAPVYPDTPPNASRSVTYYYWVRAIYSSRDVVKIGPYSNGAAASTADDPNYVLEILQNSKWKPATAVAEGSYVYPTRPNGKAYKATAAGNTGATEPNWPTAVGQSVVDGAVTWLCDADMDLDSPFMIGLVGGVVRMVIRDVLIADEAVTNSKIKNLSADKLYAAVGTIAQAIIGTGHITDAMIGNIIQSTTYVPGSSGWYINKNGTVEFNGGTFRGAVNFTGASTGYGNLIDRPDLNALRGKAYFQATDPIPVHPTFARASAATKSDGTVIASGKPRIEAGKFGGAIMLEEGTTNLYPLGIATATDLTKFGADPSATTFAIDAGRVHCITNGTAQHGFYTLDQIAVTPNAVYSGGVTLTGSGTVDVTLRSYTSGGAMFAEKKITGVVLSSSRQRIKMENFNVGASGVFCRIIVRSTTAATIDVFADEFQIEAKAYSTSFIAGTRAAETLTIPPAGLLSSTEGTVEAWVYIPSSSGVIRRIFDSRQSGYSQNVNTLEMSITAGGYLATTVSTGAGILYKTSPAPVPVGAWCHVAVTYGPFGIRLYMNGVLVNSQAGTPSIVFMGNANIGGWYSGADALNGLVDSLRISTRARTDQEIAATAASMDPPGREAGVSLLLAFDEGALWVDGSNNLWQYNGVAWETAATVGAPTGTYVGATLSQTVEGNAANGATAFTGTAKYRTAGAPTNSPAPTAITVTANSNATCNIRLDWGAYTQGANQADFLMLFWRKDGTAPTVNDAALAFNVNTAAGSYYVFEGVSPADTWSFGIAAARRTENGVEIGAIQAPASAPDWLGVTAGTPNFTASVNGVVASTLTANAANGATAYTGTAAYRDGSAPSSNGTFGTITQSQTADGNIVVTVPYTYSQGAVPADQLFIFVREGGGTVVAADPCVATNAVSGEIKFTLKPSTTYTFGIQAVKTVATGFSGTAITTSGSVATSASNFTGNVNGTAAATVVTNASNGALAWSKFSGAGGTLPAGNVEFNFASSSTKGGNATNTDNVGTQSADTVQSATINFNSRNDRNGAAVVAPVVADAAGTLDHTVNTDGSVDVSFEWTWAGNEADIDGFIVYVHDNGTTAPTAQKVLAATADASVQVFYLTPQRRAFILYGVAANHWYTFGVQAYRIVDQDVDSSGSKRSAIAQPASAAMETTYGAYRPASSVAFAGDITGTIAGTSATTVRDNAGNAVTKLNDWTKPGQTTIDGNKIYTGDAFIWSAMIRDAQVGTLKIGADAVMVPYAAFTGGSVALSSGSLTVQTLNVSFDSDVNFVTVQAVVSLQVVNGTGQSPATGIMSVELRRGATVVYSAGYVNPYAGNAGAGANFTFCVAIPDTPPGGSSTYTLVAVHGGGGTHTCWGRSIVVQGRKR